MIKNFSVLYVGNIDLEDVGSDGLPADARRYPNERLMQSMDTAEASRRADGRARLLRALDG